jgi:hypothetical protein
VTKIFNVALIGIEIAAQWYADIIATLVGGGG